MTHFKLPVFSVNLALIIPCSMERSLLMESQFPTPMLDRISAAGVMAVIVVDEAADAVSLARALIACGIDVMELTLRTPAAIEALRLVKAMLAGVGTVLHTSQIDEVMEAGAEFAVSPGLNPTVVEHAQKVGLPFAPGLVQHLVKLSGQLSWVVRLKFFPAEPSGGFSTHQKELAAPSASTSACSSLHLADQCKPAWVLPR